MKIPQLLSIKEYHFALTKVAHPNYMLLPPCALFIFSLSSNHQLVLLLPPQCHVNCRVLDQKLETSVLYCVVVTLILASYHGNRRSCRVHN